MNIIFMENTIDPLRLSHFGSLEFMARQVVEGFITGLHKSPFHGFSVEFAEHRLYNRGESIRHIDWKLFGRTEKLFVKRYEEETNLRCQIVIDHSGSMYFPLKSEINPEEPNKVTFSAYAAASLMELMRRQRDAIGLSLFHDHLDTHTRSRSSSVHHKHLLTLLSKLLNPENSLSSGKTAAAAALHHVAELTHQRSLVVIFSDMLDDEEQQDELFHALRHLRYNKHEVVLFHVLDLPFEEQLDFENRPYRFIDMETKESIKLNPVEHQTLYRSLMKERKNEIMLRCGQYRIDYVEADIRKGYDHVLMTYLLKRSKLH
jgi:uncharacterized protein (DUF58 family)